MDDRDQKSLNTLLSEQSPEQLQAIGQALAEAAAESHALLSEVMSSSSAGMEIPENADPFGMMDTYGRLGKSLATNPSALMTANLDLWMSWVNLWKDFTTGEIGTSGDKRFKDPEWSANPAFEFMRRAYELNAEWMLSLLNAADDLSDADRRKARFYMRQTVDALSPTNFFATNPSALKAMLETGGQSLVEGLRNARADMRKGRGKLAISQTDETSFEVGRNVATAPGKVVYRNRLIELLQFEPATEKVHARPLLIFPPWINKYYILDLSERNSMIRWLVSQGFTVFVVSWRSADEETRELTWDDYVSEGVMAALHEVTTRTGSSDVNTVGYCIGGTLLTSALAYMAQSEDRRIASATFFASQSDFSDAGDLMVFADETSRKTVGQVIEANNGIMPGELMGETFNWLRPVDLVWRYVVDNYMLGKKPRPFDLLYWNADQTNIPGKTHRTYLDAFYGENRLSRGEFSVLGKTVSMEDIDIPVTIQASREDHICPWHSIYRGAQRYGGDVNFILAGSGHIAGVINHPDAQKYQHWMNDTLPDTPEAWLADAEELKGSWWPSWMRWLKPIAGEMVTAKPVPDRGLGEAPGTYVKMRLKPIADGEKPSTDYAKPAKAAPKKTKSTSTAASKTASAKAKTSTASNAAKSKKPAASAKRKSGSRKNQGKSGRSTSSPSA
ncbi:class I poly(R)-hydroxyalkanoic acid synthase [Henriciella sp.]|uniref:PHA/PHB synthase family protein n=1 Tax=Henriciella sp. TaxID=1968823 RepID=UPI002614D796|nr:class I poly(R)-hydroxyalkanoic acid synthase [Henriciella sp.]